MLKSALIAVCLLSGCATSSVSQSYLSQEGFPQSIYWGGLPNKEGMCSNGGIIKKDVNTCIYAENKFPSIKVNILKINKGKEVFESQIILNYETYDDKGNLETPKIDKTIFKATKVESYDYRCIGVMIYIKTLTNYNYIFSNGMGGTNQFPITKNKSFCVPFIDPNYVFTSNQYSNNISPSVYKIQIITQ